MDSPRIIGMPLVRRLTSLSAGTIYREIARDAFPKPVRLSKGRVGWVEEEVLAWVRRIIQRSRAPSG